LWSISLPSLLLPSRPSSRRMRLRDVFFFLASFCLAVGLLPPYIFKYSALQSRSSRYCLNDFIFTILPLLLLLDLSHKFCVGFHLLRFTGVTFFPEAPFIPTFVFSAFFAFNSLADIPLLVLGVALLIFLLGRQYSFFPPSPHSLPVRVSFHFSFSHLRRFDPSFDLLTCPFSLRHFAVACAARADHLPYDAMIFR